MSEGGKNAGVEAQLFHIGFTLNRIANAVERIEASLKRAWPQPTVVTTLEQFSPQGSEREEIALRFCLHTERTPEEAFRAADWFLQERDRQRAQAGET